MSSRAAEYDDAAQRFRSCATALTDAAGPLGRSLSTAALTGGAVRDVLDDALGVAIRNHVQIAHELQALASEADRRAEVCRAHEQAIRRYEAALATWSTAPLGERQGRPPAPPAPLARWVVG